MQNFFQLLGLEPTLRLDEAAIHQAYLAAQRASHPDRHTDVVERMKTLQHSADVNGAYRILKNPLTRAEHLLALRGITVGTERDSVKPTQSLLIESMEMREALMEATSREEITALEQRAHGSLERIYDAVESHLLAARYADAAQETLRWRFLEKYLDELRAAKKGLGV